MKKLLLVVVVGLVFISAGVAVGQHYKNYQTQKSQEARVSAQKQADEIANIRNEAKVNAEALNREVERLRAECEKGVIIYGSLTATQKAKTVRPVCDAQ